jgi:two-component system, sensor histidine kinase and response regulator
MQADIMQNIIILAVVGGILVFVAATAVRMKLAQAKAPVTDAEEDDRLYESREAIPKLPRNETLYHIIKNSTFAVNKIVFDPNYVFDEVASLLRNDIHVTGVELLFDIGADVPGQLIGSPKRLSRALINLIENAVQYSDGGVVVMQVGAEQNNGMDCRLRFTIRDQGRGMDGAQIEALDTDPQERGTDGKMPYGYFVAHQIVVAEGGTITVESRPGRGTTVSFDMNFKLPQTHRASAEWKPSKAYAALRIAVVVRHAQTAQIIKKHLDPCVAEVMALITETPFLGTKPFEGYDMVIIEHRLSDRALFYALKKEGVWLVLLKSVFDHVAGEGHVAADYLLSLPFTRERLLQMLTIFYGEAAAPASKRKEAVKPQLPGGFVDDADIPVTADVSKKDFERFVGARVLVVEDNPINQRMTRGLLGDSGIRLFFAENGQEAMEVAAKEGPMDLVLMDINMPVLDGLEATRRLRREPQFETMPIVAFTGLNQKEQIKSMMAAGMNAHMVKPLNIGRLYTLFDLFLSKTGTGAAA